MLCSSNEYQVFQRIIKLEYEFPNGFPECPKALVEQLLVSNTSAVNFTSIKCMYSVLNDTISGAGLFESWIELSTG